MAKKSQGGCGGIISLLGLIVAVIAIAVGVTNEEIRCELGLECDEEVGVALYDPDGPSVIDTTDLNGTAYTLMLCEARSVYEGTLVGADIVNRVEKALQDDGIAYASVEFIDDLTLMIHGVNSEYAVNQALSKVRLEGIDDSTLCE